MFLLSIVSELNKEFPAIWLVEQLHIWRYFHRGRQKGNITFMSLVLSLPSWQLNMVHCSWMDFSFIWMIPLKVQDIWKDEEFSKWLLSPLYQKSFQELVLKTFKNHKHGGYVGNRSFRPKSFSPNSESFRPNLKVISPQLKVVSPQLEVV